MFETKFTRQMKISWICLALCLLILEWLQPTELFDAKVVSIVISVVEPGILVYLIRFVRHWRSAISAEAEATELSTWSYFWRGVVLFFFKVPILSLLNNFVPMKLVANEITAIELVLWEAPLAFGSALGAWLLFSKDRRGQLQLLVASIRGY